MHDVCFYDSLAPTARALAIAVLTLGASMAVSARESASGALLDEIVVTATRSEQRLGDLPRSVSVVTREEIERLQAPSALNVLRTLPGISAASDGGLGGQLVIRGFSTQGFRAPLFIDGDRFRGRNTLEYNLFNPHQIERIEVVRGPTSSLYGTDSFGGIINIITKRASGDPNGPFALSDTALWLDYGSVNGMYGGRFQVGGAGNGFDFLLGGNFREAGNYSSPAGEISHSGYESNSADLSIGYRLAPGQRIEFIGRFSDIYRERAGGQFGAPGAEGGPDAPIRLQTDRDLTEEFVSLVYTAESLFDGALFNTRVSLYERDLDTQVNVVPNARNPDVFVDVFVTGPTVRGGSAQSSFSLGAPLTLTVGGDWYDEERPGGLRAVRGGPVVQDSPESSQLAWGVFALADWQVAPTLRVEGSLRFDQVETELDTTFITDPVTRDLFEQAGTRENSPTTGSLGAIWQVTEAVSTFANVATAFRAPSVTEITAVGTGVNPIFRVPNANIDPEEAVNYEAGLRIEVPSLYLELAGFSNQLDDLIDRNAPTSFEGAPAVQIQNIGEAEVEGFEVQAGWSPHPDWRLRANATYTRGTNEITGRPLPQIMPLNGLAGVQWAPAGRGFSVEAALDWALDNDRVDLDQERERDGYAVINLYAVAELQKISRNLPAATVRLSVENLFDTQYRLPTTPENTAFPVSPSNPLVQPGLNLLLGLEYRL